MIRGGINYGSKRRYAINLHNQGKYLEEIATLTQCDRETVRGWIKDEGLQPLHERKKSKPKILGRFAHLK
jgi:predicted transcriptional regulator